MTMNDGLLYGTFSLFKVVFPLLTPPSYRNQLTDL